MTTQLSQAAKAIAFKQYFGPVKTGWATAAAAYDAVVAGEYEIDYASEYKILGMTFWAFRPSFVPEFLIEDAERWQRCMDYFNGPPAPPPGYTADELEIDNPYNPT